MRITFQFLHQRAHTALPALEYLDLSNGNIEFIERLGMCKKLQYLRLQGNYIQNVSNLNCCPFLWTLDLSCNKVQCLDGLSQFLCFGTLILSNNDLSWKEMVKIQHIHIINLSLHGNPQLEKDNYYRIHAVDCLPNVWILDGRIVTSAERIQVKNFFQDSALTSHPVRRKLTRDWFIPSAMKNIELTGLFGPKTTALMTKFPVNAVHNIELDKKRLQYVAHNLQEDIKIEQKACKSAKKPFKNRKTFIEDLLTERNGEKEKCNMLLLLLVASLEFVLPTNLVKETLETTMLQKIGSMHSMDLFLLPKDVRCRVVSILLSAVKIDKDNKENGGLYDKLYLCLFFLVSQLTRLSQTNKQVTRSPQCQLLHNEYRCLLASEVVQLLCVVPAMFEYLEGDVGVMNLIATATDDRNISQTITHMLDTAYGHMEESKIFEDVSNLILRKVQDQMLNISNRSPSQPQGDIIINRMKAIPMKISDSPLQRSEYHARGVSCPEHLKSKLSIDPTAPLPQLGDLILIGPQTFGKIISLPQSDVVLVSMDSVPVSNGAMVSKLKESEDHYTYVNMNYLSWDSTCGFWKPIGTKGDRLTLQRVEENVEDTERNLSLPSRPNSPVDPPSHQHHPGSYKPSQPLIFTPRKYSTSLMEKSHKIKKPPRPMSSVLKEKLDLKLDLNKTRAKSAKAGRVCDRKREEREAGRMFDREREEGTDSQLEAKTSECSLCQFHGVTDHHHQESLVKSIIEEHEELFATEQPDQRENEDGEQAEGKSIRPTSSKSDIPSTNRETSTKPGLKQRPTTAKANLTSSVTETTAIPPTTSNTSLNLDIALPRFEVEDNETVRSSEIDSQHKQSVEKKSSSKKVVARKTSSKTPAKERSFSAVDAYKTFVGQSSGVAPPCNQGNLSYMSDFQRARTEAWKSAPKNVISEKTTPPPPQRPTSPSSSDKKPSPGVKVHVTRANDWLGGGRNLHLEMTKSRPRSGHVPGWKEGLPSSLSRPRSGQVVKTRPESTGINPQMLPIYNSLICGSTKDVTEFPILCNYTCLPQQMVVPRHMGVFPAQLKDTEYYDHQFDMLYQ